MTRKGERQATPVIWHSPTERGEIIRHLGRYSGGNIKSSGIPESRGVDYVWEHNDTWHGVQRKELSDFLASLQDGRLAKEIGQMRASITMPMLVIEESAGQPQWAHPHELDGGTWAGYTGRPITWAALQKILLTIRAQGIGIAATSGPRQTAQWIVAMRDWSMKETHSIKGRPTPKDDWGNATNRDWQMHLLTALDGIGPKTANAILDHLGESPIKVTVDEQTLCQIPGIGAVTARRIIHSINGPSESTTKIKRRKTKKGKDK